MEKIIKYSSNTLFKKAYYASNYKVCGKIRRMKLKRELERIFNNCSEIQNGVFIKQPDINEYCSAESLSNDKIIEIEWNVNEIYLFKKYIKKSLKDVVDTIILTIFNSLKKKYPDKSFCIVLSIDMGEYFNITTTFHTYFGNLIIDGDLEGFDQPVLYVII